MALHAIGLDLEPLPGASGLVSPVGLADPGDGSGRLFIVEQGGTIRIWQNDALLPEPFLTIPAEELACCNERGLLALAFHPDFATNGYFFVNYTEPEPVDPPSCPPPESGAGCNENSVVARFRVQSFVDPPSGDPNLADFATEERILRYNQPFGTHNFGELRFGPDGYLYIGSGDGGSEGDPLDFAQSVSTLLGKILRIDVDAMPPPDHGLCGDSPQAYAAPPGNPYLGAEGCDEIWHLGLRNPWRFSFDRETGDMFIGDVGQRVREEIDFRPAGSPGGANWGWRCYEGTSAYNTTDCGELGDYLSPIYEYQHFARCAVTGGFRYRGSLHPQLVGYYLFADYCSGEIWSAVPTGSGGWTVFGPHYDATFRIPSFAEDAAGELYVIGYDNGIVYRLVENGGTPTATITPTATPSPTATASPTATPTPLPSRFDVDLDGQPDSLTDGVIILRWLFGFRGDTLITGSVAPGCLRCEAPEIESYLASLAVDLDVDGNSVTDALTDGALVLRWLFGFRGPALVAEAVAPECTRCEPEEIDAYLEAL
jgi:glucose/arabinose dehydrogenase